MTTGDQPHFGGDLDNAVRDVLRRDHPDTWNAIIARANKQKNTYPNGMGNASEPAYRYCPGEA